MRPFMHPADVPVRFALMVHRVMHNTASWSDWESLDTYALLFGFDPVLDWIVAILEMNGTAKEDLPKERAWWSRELRKNHN